MKKKYNARKKNLYPILLKLPIYEEEKIDESVKPTDKKAVIKTVVAALVIFMLLFTLLFTLYYVFKAFQKDS